MRYGVIWKQTGNDLAHCEEEKNGVDNKRGADEHADSTCHCHISLLRHDTALFFLNPQTAFRSWLILVPIAVIAVLLDRIGWVTLPLHTK